MAAITRQHCPACAQDFPAHSGGAIPYRCPCCVKLVLGPYCDLQWIGGGGMGDVYRAREPASGDRTVAIKVPKTTVRMLRPDVSDAFDALIQSMMAIEPQDRPSPRQVVDALQTILATLADDQATPIKGETGRRIDVECPECGTVYHLLPSAAGRPMQCPNKLCRLTFVVPLPASEPREVAEAEIAGPDHAGETSFFAARRQPAGPLAGHFALILGRRSPKAGSSHRAIPRSILAAGGLGAEKLEAPGGAQKTSCGSALTWYARPC